MVSIVTDEAVRSGDPRIEGTRITVLDVKRRVIDGDEDPFSVATEYDLDVAAVFQALAYYFEHTEEMQEREAAAQTRREQLRRDSERRRAQLGGRGTGSELEST